MLAKLFAVAAGCTFAVISFAAGAVPALPLPLQQPLHVTQIVGGCAPGWHRGPYGGLPAQLGSGRPPLLVPVNALGPSPCLPLVKADEAGNPCLGVFFYPANPRTRIFLARHLAASVPIVLPR